MDLTEPKSFYDKRIIMAKQRTVTFQPDADVERYLMEAEKRGRGVRTEIINQALRDCGERVLGRWDHLRRPKLSSFQHADPQSGGLVSAA